MSALQNNRGEIVWEGPGDFTQIEEFHLLDRVSRPFQLSVRLRSKNPALSLADLIDQKAKIKLKTGPNRDQDVPFSGWVTEAAHQQSSFANIGTATNKYYFYSIILRPRLWYLEKVFRSRVYNKKSVKDIVAEVLGEFNVPFEWKANAIPKKREYTLQFQETCLAFVQRLLEDEGVAYCYDHEKESITLFDHPSQLPACAPTNAVDYIEHAGGTTMSAKREFVFQMRYGARLSSGSFVGNDYNFETAQMNLLKQGQASAPPHLSNLEYYHHRNNRMDAGTVQTFTDNMKEAEESMADSASGASNCRSFQTGRTFKLDKHYCGDVNTTWMLLETRIRAEHGRYHCDFTTLKADRAYRPPRLTPWPRVFGMQTAVVTGPSGSKVYLDKLGRCKLQFHWDREGKKDDMSSMWVRVSNGYAGKDYGIQWIPRVGHEVLVEFIDGNPDRPVVAGRVYNDFNTPPLGPPKKWQNIIKTIKDNHILFDDEDDKELIDIRAQKDMNYHILNDRNIRVDHEATEWVKMNKSFEVKEEDYQHKIGRHQTVDIGKNYSQTVGENKVMTVAKDHVSEIGVNQTGKVGKNQALEVGGAKSEKVKKDNALEVGKNYTIKVDSNLEVDTSKGHITLKSPKKIELKCGGSKITMKPSGIELKMGGSTVKLSAMGVTVKGTVVRIN